MRYQNVSWYRGARSNSRSLDLCCTITHLEMGYCRRVKPHLSTGLFGVVVTFWFLQVRWPGFESRPESVFFFFKLVCHFEVVRTCGGVVLLDNSKCFRLNLVEQLIAKWYDSSKDTNARSNSSLLKSLPESQVKQRWARLTHGWVTAWEYRVPLYFSSSFLCITTHDYHRYRQVLIWKFVPWRYK